MLRRNIMKAKKERKTLAAKLMAMVAHVTLRYVPPLSEDNFDYHVSHCERFLGAEPFWNPLLFACFRRYRLLRGG